MLSNRLPPARRSASRRTANTRIPGTDGGSVGTSKTGRPNPCSNSLQTSCGDAIPSAAGNATTSPGRSRDVSSVITVRRKSRWSNARASPSALNSTRPSTGRCNSVARAVTDGSVRDSPSASSAGWKSLSPRNPTAITSVTDRRSPPAIVTGASAVGFGTPIAVGSSRFSSSDPVYV